MMLLATIFAIAICGTAPNDNAPCVFIGPNRPMIFSSCESGFTMAQKMYGAGIRERLRCVKKEVPSWESAE